MSESVRQMQERLELYINEQEVRRRRVDGGDRAGHQELRNLQGSRLAGSGLRRKEREAWRGDT